MDVTMTGIDKSYSGVQAVQSISIRLEQGKFTTLLGPSGCGKTTLLRMIAGLETPDHGELSIGDQVVYSKARRIDIPTHKRKIGMVFQDFSLWPHLTVFENTAYSLRATGQTAKLRERVASALEMVRLQSFGDRYPHQLSGGQQQRVAFARAIANEPKLILFDEPLSALDAILREEMRAELSFLVRNLGLTAVFVTHDQIEAMSMSDRIIVMKEGQLLQTGSPEDIYHHPIDPFVAKFIGKSNWLNQGKALIRPEKVSLMHREGCLTFSGQIVLVHYAGDRYEVQVNVPDLGIWTVYADQRLLPGERIILYVNPDDIHQLSHKQEAALQV